MLRNVLKLNIAPLVALSLAYTASACPLELPLDDMMATPSSFGDYLTRDTTYFMLLGLTDGRSAAILDYGDRWSVDCDALPSDVVQGVRETLAYDGTIDPRQVRLLYEANYHKTITRRRQESVIKSTEAELRAATNFTTWSNRTVPFSHIKRKSRRVFRSPADFFPTTSVSQTLDSETGDQNAVVLETEVAVKRAASDGWDFYAYNKEGVLSEYSTFPSGQRASPNICINCHYDAGSRAVERFLP